MSIGQMNDKDAPVGSLIIAMVAMEQSGLIRALVSPEILEVLAHHVLPMTSVVERDLFTHAANETNGAVGSTVLSVRWGAASPAAIGGRGRSCQELLHADLIVDEMLLLHGQGLRFQKRGTSSGQHFLVNFIDLNGNKYV